MVGRCSPNANRDLFNWTIGGMGLTGIVLRAAFRLQPVETGWVRQRSLVAKNIDHAIDLFEGNLNSTYSVAWIDCMARGARLGQSLITLGEHARREEIDAAAQSMPRFPQPKRGRYIGIDFPNFTLNNLSVRCFNTLYYLKGKSAAADRLVSWDSYFYPLDKILGWNRIYGRRGFSQYQVIRGTIPSGLHALLECISQSGCASFLAVLKRFGKQRGKFSFPFEGYTLALDFPVTARSLDLMNKLDEITSHHGGRLNLAKDSRISAEVLATMDDRAGKFRQYRQDEGINQIFSSEQSIRLKL